MSLFKFIPFFNLCRGKLRRKTFYIVIIMFLSIHLCWHLNEDILHCPSEVGRIETPDKCGYIVDNISSNRPVVGCTTDRRVIYKDAVRVLGTGLKKKGFLTIGLPTIERIYKNVTATYLENTLDSLMSALTLNEMSEVHIVIFLADFKKQARNNVKRRIVKKYKHLIDINFINVIEAPRRYYSKLQGLVRTFGDSQERMFWRSKQNLDYAFLFQYSEGLSKYYMQLEDDVASNNRFLSTIKKCMEEYKKFNYALLETSVWGFIGKIFKDEDLDYFSRMLRMFYNDLPCDWLLKNYISWRGDPSGILDRLCAHIFEHVGSQSSSLGT